MKHSTKDTKERKHLNKPSRIPGGSFVFDKFIPILLIIMGIMTVGLILFAAGVLLGFIQF
ncbi:MAG TPA: hypothetical protein VNK49_13345 [Anaerolineales bacterium]|nr:hypothetical protein [Anaerolineales bacterium]